jgi:CheY-like chemotaxis protein
MAAGQRSGKQLQSPGTQNPNTIETYTGRLPVILQIENDNDDAFLFHRALSKLDFRGVVHLVSTVAEACAYLNGEGQCADRSCHPFPDLVVSDMNLPGPSGNVFLEWLRKDERFRGLPVVFLSGSFSVLDKVRAEALGAEGFFVKAGDVALLRERARSILNYLRLEESEPPTVA